VYASKPIGYSPTTNTKKISRRLDVCVRVERGRECSETSVTRPLLPFHHQVVSRSPHSIHFPARLLTTWKCVRNVHGPVARTRVHAPQGETQARRGTASPQMCSLSGKAYCEAPRVGCLAWRNSSMTVGCVPKHWRASWGLIQPIRNGLVYPVVNKKDSISLTWRVEQT
jgi:hypothetical protein